MRSLLVLTLVLALAGCKAEMTAPPKSATLSPVPADHPAVTPLPDPELQAGHVGRAPRRLTVAQLKTSILTVTGRQWSQIDNLAGSLGKADYALVNAESTEANLVFAKFLEDGAREVCTATAAADLTQADQTQRVLTREIPTTVTDFTTLDDATVSNNLTYLSRRFWGEPLSGAELDTWTTAFKGFATAAKAANSNKQAWGAICVALMTDPRFITY